MIRVLVEKDKSELRSDTKDETEGRSTGAYGDVGQPEMINGDGGEDVEKTGGEVTQVGMAVSGLVTETLKDLIESGYSAQDLLGWIQRVATVGKERSFGGSGQEEKHELKPINVNLRRSNCNLDEQIKEGKKERRFSSTEVWREAYVLLC